MTKTELMLRDIRLEAERQVRERLIQGAVCTATGMDTILAVGNQNVTPNKVPMTPNSRFDMASVGKTFTATCVAFLVHQGKVDPDAPFTDYIPQHPMAGQHCDITVRDLAMHVGGFSNDKPYSSENWQDFLHELYHKKPVRPTRQDFEYACSNFILLGRIVELVTGQTLEQAAQDFIWKPLGMTHTQWTSPGPGPYEVEHWDPHRPAGQHNDTECFKCPRPIGSGSCFSTAQDMLKFASEIAKPKVFPLEVIQLMTTCGFQKNGVRRSFGWDMTGKKIPDNMSAQTVLHSGYTGQTICADPQTGKAAVVLTSRTGDWTKAMEARRHLMGLMARFS